MKVSLLIRLHAELLIEIAHPDFQDQLVKDAEAMGLWHRTSRRFY